MIVGQGIRLRSIERTDLPTLVTWLNDPELRDHLAAYLPISLAEEERWFERLAERPREQRPWLIEVQADGRWLLIGSCSLHDVDWRIRSGMLGIMIGDKAEWSKGYGSRAVALLVQFAFETSTCIASACRSMQTMPGPSGPMKRSALCWKAACETANFAMARTATS